MTRRAILAGISALSLVVLLLTGCWQKTPEPQPAKLKSVKLLIDWKAEPTYAGFYISRKRGSYKSRGIDLEIVEGNGATTSAQVIGSGQSYFIGSCSGAATAIARSKGIPVKSVAVYYPNVPTVLYSAPPRQSKSPKT